HLRKETKYYIVADDSAEEMLIRKGFYNHDLYLIEVTKIAECYVVDTLTFTNDAGRSYTENAGYAIATKADGSEWGMAEGAIGNTYYHTAYAQNTDLEIKSFFWLVYPNTSIYSFTITLIYPNGERREVDDKGSHSNRFWSTNMVLNQQGPYRLEYRHSGELYMYYSFLVIENKLPLKKWTITDVINRTLDLAEPIRKGEKPRFKLNAEQAALFDKILAPEFAFTKQTLRECLQEVGGVVHGEPRLKPVKDEDGYYYEVSYDMYAGQEVSGIYTRPYIKKTVGQLIDSYASHLDSNAENLVNQLDKYGGVIVEPYAGGAKSVRTESNYVRIEEGNMIIATQYPIYSVQKLEFVAYIDGQWKFIDITPWLFEKSIYDTQLSSYEKQYPYSKIYGLYYTQGQKNIGGLNFKVPNAKGDAYENYAIVNIVRQATGNKDYSLGNYPENSYRVTYTPFYNARVTQTKSYFKDFIRPAALIYNQQSNVIESRYYGENLKGAIVRLGTIEKSLTFNLYNIRLIPKAGQMYNKDYYISAVTVELLPTVIKCTIGLSKDFNRLSKYIGVSSVKRFSEISQTQAVERNTLYREYIVIGEKEEPDTDCLMESVMLQLIAFTFKYPFTESYGPITNVTAWGTSYKGNLTGSAVNLPVISSAFGNSISFSWKYEDNYSAGAISQYQQNDNVSGFFQNSCPYTDYYGKIYYYNFDLQLWGPQPEKDTLLQIARDLPRGSVPTESSNIVSTIGKAPFIMRKDNREALQVNFQIDFVTNFENLIIGSALASYCPAVRGTNMDLNPKLYVFPTELNKFTDHVEAFENVDLETMAAAEIEVTVENGYFVVSADKFPASGKSWAIVTKQYPKPAERVEDEQGNEFDQEEVMGGDLLIGQNIEVTEGQSFTPIYFTQKREIFDKSVWKERR
ncbi:MAG: hypothetical protein K2N30_02585, partial [Clostridia bacterium]|nr:hypothetical protein [Clostridia bacterium]